MTTLAQTQITASANTNLAVIEAMRSGFVRTAANPPAKRDEEQTMTVIAMTREIGSLGTAVAERLAARLGLKVIHSEVVAEGVAGRLGVEAGAVLRYVNGSATLLERCQIDRRRVSLMPYKQGLGFITT